MTANSIDVQDHTARTLGTQRTAPAARAAGSPAQPYLQGLRALAPLVEHHAPEADRNRCLADPVVEALRDRGLLRLLVSRQDGGGGLTRLEFFSIVEAASRLDGAVGWNLCVANIALEATVDALGVDARAELLANSELLLAGAIRPGAVTATPVESGWSFDGEIAFASGATHATHFVTASAVDPDDAATFGVMRCGLAPRSEIEILDTWHASGLRATASTNVRFRNIVIPERFTFLLSPAASVPGDVPFASRLGAGLSWVAVGIATRALDRITALARSAVRFGGTQPLASLPDVQIAVARARALIESGRSYLLAAWSSAEAVLRTPFTDDDLAGLRLSYVTATQQAIAATDALWEASGSAALYENEGLERCWRDIHAVGQHAMVSSRHLGRLGQISLGLPAGPGPI